MVKPIEAREIHMSAAENPRTIRAPFPYMGGKSHLAKQIIPLFPNHHTYVEPFCGAAWVFLNKKPSKVEVINDLSGELVNLWRVIQNHHDELLRYFRFAIISREQFNWEKSRPTAHLTDIQRAARFFYIQRLSFSGRPDYPSFSSSPDCASNLNPNRLRQDLEAVHSRIKRTYIENLDAIDCISRYDRSKTFFYIDPPYWKRRGYKHLMNEEDFKRLRNTLLTLKGRFILSLNECPEVRELFAEFTFQTVDTFYSVANYRSSPDSKRKTKELLIHNLQPP